LLAMTSLVFDASFLWLAIHGSHPACQTGQADASVVKNFSRKFFMA